LRGTAHTALGHFDRARADQAKALALQPNDPVTLNNIAWQYVTGPIAQRDPARALPLIQKAIELRPNESMYQNTLGVALYRNGDFVPAIDSLKKSLDLGRGQSDGFDLFFLAMCHKKLGDAAQAKNCFDRAVLWTQQRQDKLPAEWAKDLAAFRAEAESVLNVP
jgi:tetratricopeptide (TPR) repeat protein